LPVRSVKDLISVAKSKPGEINYGTFGVGSTGHLNMEMLQMMAGIKLTPVHYKGAVPALTDVMAGQIDAMFISVGTALPAARSGKVTLLATGGAERLAQLPDVPTVAENGLPGFEAVSWFGLFAPKATPNDVVIKLNREVGKIFGDPEFRRSFLDPQFLEPMPGSPDEFAAFIRRDERKWSQIVRTAGVKIE
jgi:tripartite-type tricarboxylate transporter receptor subunit TctC